MIQPQLFFRDLCVLAISDGQLAPAELKQLRVEAQRLNLSHELARQELEAVIARPRLSLWVPPERQQTHSLYAALIRLAACDGNIANSELALIERVGYYLGLSPDQVDDDLAKISARHRRVNPQIVVEPRYNKLAFVVAGALSVMTALALSLLFIF